MAIFTQVKQTLLLAALALFSATAFAQWELDNEHSSINFISIKNSAVAESHQFESLVGYVGRDGAVQLGINLDSVQTLIDIRNERMRESLFETDKFPAANVTATVDPAVLQAAVEGGTVSTEVAFQLSLHGQKKTLRAPLVAVGEAGGVLRVFSARPLVINAADFGLEGGVQALQKIAGLNAISTAVPVSLHLVFRPVAQ